MRFVSCLHTFNYYVSVGLLSVAAFLRDRSGASPASAFCEVAFLRVCRLEGVGASAWPPGAVSADAAFLRVCRLGAGAAGVCPSSASACWLEAAAAVGFLRVRRLGKVGCSVWASACWAPADSEASAS